MILSSWKDSILGRKAVSHEEGLQEQGEDDIKNRQGARSRPPKWLGSTSPPVLRPDLLPRKRRGRW